MHLRTRKFCFSYLCGEVDPCIAGLARYTCVLIGDQGPHVALHVVNAAEVMGFVQGWASKLLSFCGPGDAPAPSQLAGKCVHVVTGRAG